VRSLPDDRYDAAVASALPAVCTGLSLVFLSSAGLHLLLAEGPHRLLVGIIAAATSVSLGLAALLLRRVEVPPRWAHPATAVVALVVVAESVAVLVLTGEPRQSTTVMLAIVASGAALVSTRWLVGVLYLCWAGWGLGVYLVGPDDSWPHFAVGLAAATALSAVISTIRRQGVEALVTARALADAAAVRDQLTGLANRRGLAMLGSQIVEHARRMGDAVHCIFIDVDGLAKVTAAAGDETGDAVLLAVSDALRSVTRATDVVSRWSGNQFLVLGPGPGMPPLELERRVREHVVGHGGVDPSWPARVSAGGAMLAPWDSGTLDTLLGKADQEMHLRRALRRDATGGRTRLADPSEA